MPERRPSIADMRKVLALTADLFEMQGDFEACIEKLLAGLGEILDADNVSAFRLRMGRATQKANPIVEMRRNEAGKWARTNLVGEVISRHWTLTLMSRVGRSQTDIGYPAWLTQGIAKPFIRREVFLYSVQFPEHAPAVALLAQRSRYRSGFSSRDGQLCDLVWRSFPIDAR